MWQALVKMVEKWSCGHDWEIIYRKDYDDQKQKVNGKKVVEHTHD